MRHDDSSKRPRIDPAQNPRLAAALGRLSQGMGDAVDEAPITRPSRPEPTGELIRSTSDDEVYVPDNDELELLDDGAETTQEPGFSEFALNTGGISHPFQGEMIPPSGELDRLDSPGVAPDALPPTSLERTPTPSFRPGVIAYGAPLPPEEPASSGDEVLEPSDSELELIDASRPEEPPPDADGAPAAATDLDATPLYTPAEPSGEPIEPLEPVASPEASPWAAAAAEKAIDVRALPSALAPIAPAADVPKAKPEAEPSEATAGKGGRSWLTIFLAIALVASIVTFLLLKFNVVDGPEGRPSADTTPIQVPTSAPAATLAPAAPVVPSAEPAPEPAASAASEPSTLEPSAAPAASDTTEAAAAPSGAASSAAPGTPVVGTGKAPVKPSGPSQSGKKPSRIF